MSAGATAADAGIVTVIFSLTVSHSPSRRLSTAGSIVTVTASVTSAGTGLMSGGKRTFRSVPNWMS